MDWELVDLSVFFMMELRGVLSLLPVGGLLTGDTDRGRLLKE